MNIRLVFYAGLIGLGSCSAPQEKQPSFIRPVKVFRVESLAHIDKDFAGMSTAGSISNLAFRVSGQLLKVNVVDGQSVQKDQIIAEIDPREYLLQMEADKASYLTLQSQMQRNKRLIEKQAISQQDYEIAEANFVRAQSAYNNSKSILNDTKLRAPFTGAIEKLYVDNYQRVQAGQEVARLVDPVTNIVKFTMPETALQTLKLPDIHFSVTFDNYKGVSFPARLREYVQSATQSTGIAVSLLLDKVDPKYDIAPGLSCMVNIKVNNPGYKNVTAVPISAIFSLDNKKMVWIVVNNTVTAREVKLGMLFGTDMVAISSGLSAGEEVVTAGVYQIVEGEKVKLLN